MPRPEVNASCGWTYLVMACHARHHALVIAWAVDAGTMLLRTAGWWLVLSTGTMNEREGGYVAKETAREMGANASYAMRAFWFHKTCLWSLQVIFGRRKITLNAWQFIVRTDLCAVHIAVLLRSETEVG